MFTEHAEADLDDTFQYYFLRDPNYADDWRRGLIDSVHTLSSFPARCTIAQESASFRQDVRLHLYRKGRTVFRILFLIIDNYEADLHVVQILRIQHGAKRIL